MKHGDAMEFAAGQHVRATWPDGTVVSGTVLSDSCECPCFVLSATKTGDRMWLAQNGHLTGVFQDAEIRTVVDPSVRVFSSREAEIREKVAKELASVDRVEWALAGQWAGDLAARIALGEVV